MSIAFIYALFPRAEATRILPMSDIYLSFSIL